MTWQGAPNWTTAWTTPVIASGFVAPLGPGYQQPGFKRIGQQVFLRGTFSVTNGVGAGGTLVVGLPAPQRETILRAVLNNGIARVDVFTDGSLSFPANALSTGQFFSLDGISYWLD
jgi:hypothetical protein